MPASIPGTRAGRNPATAKQQQDCRGIDDAADRNQERECSLVAQRTQLRDMGGRAILCLLMANQVDSPLLYLDYVNTFGADNTT